jgi:hypothetical protein
LTPIEIFPPGILIDFVALRIEVIIELNIFIPLLFWLFSSWENGCYDILPS